MKLDRQLISTIFITILGEITCFTETSISIVNEEGDVELQESSSVLLDKDEFGWNITSVPYKYYIEYYNLSNEINCTILNSPEFNLNPFLDVHGVWVFPYTFKFDELFYAYFNRDRNFNPRGWDRFEIIGYLHENAELRIFNDPAATETIVVFQGTTKDKWETFVVHMDKSSFTFRAEIHVNKTGGFGFIDKIIGHRNVSTVPTIPTLPPAPTEAPRPTDAGTTSLSPETTKSSSATTTTTPKTTPSFANRNSYVNIFTILLVILLNVLS